MDYYATPRNFRVSFIKKATEEGKDELLGIITLDDYGTSDSFTLLAKAFRQAPANYFMADKTITERI